MKTAPSPDHTTAIGRLVIAVSKIDTLLTDLAAILLQTDVFSAITAIHHQQIANKIDTLKTLVKLKIKSGEGTQVLQLLSETKSIVNYRNSLVHAHWSIDKEGETYAARFETRGKFKHWRQAEQKAERADEIADQLGGLRDRLWQSNTLREQ